MNVHLKILLASFALTLAACSGSTQPSDAASPSTQPARGTPLPDDVVSSVREAFGAYEEARAALVADQLDGLASPAGRLSTALERASTALPADQGPAAAHLVAARGAAERMGQAPELPVARLAFGELSRALVGLVEIDPRLGEGRHVYSCPMAKGFKRWIQTSEGIDNPYMGQAMPGCGTEADWGLDEDGSGDGADAAPSDGGHDGHADHDHEADYWTCSMHPSVRGKQGDTCPICGMDLTPVGGVPDAAPASVTVDEARRRQVGVGTAVASVEPMTRTLRTYGRFAWAEDGLTDIDLRVAGWVTRLYASRTGDPVRRGQALFRLYSPDLFAAQQDWLRLRAGGASPSLVRAARERLRLWGLTEAQLEAIASDGVAREEIDVLAPRAGILLERHIVEGGSVRPGDRALRIVDASRVWVEAEVFEHDLPLVAAGQAALIVPLNADPADPPLDARVAYVYPDVDAATRAGRVRLVVENPAGTLRPGGLAEVAIDRDLGERLQVPASAVLYTGPRRVVFIDDGDGRLTPRDVTTGRRQGDAVEILEGIEPGDRVATSGTFVLAAESRIRDATGFWRNDG